MYSHAPQMAGTHPLQSAHAASEINYQYFGKAAGTSYQTTLSHPQTASTTSKIAIVAPQNLPDPIKGAPKNRHLSL